MNSNRFLALHFELTNRCNLRCKHCYNIKYIESDEDELSTEDVKNIISKAEEIGCKDIGFSGGEPFMRSDFIEILEYSKKYPIHVLTNGVLLNHEMIEKINSIDNLLIEFRISLDGLKSHKILRNIDYKVVLQNIKELLNNGYVVTVNTMITNDNIYELKEMYNLFKDIGIDRWRLDFIFNAGNASINNLNYIGDDKFFGTLRELIKTYIDERPKFEMDINKIFRSAFLNNFKAMKYTLDTKPCEYQGSLTVRPNGMVSFCPSLEHTYGNLLKDGIDNIVSSREWENFSNLKVSDLSEECINCKYLEFCGGGCRADAYYETGDIYGVCKFTCKLVKFYVDEVIPMLNDYKRIKYEKEF